MAQPVKFKFDTVFASVAGKSGWSETFSNHDLEAAREEGWRAGVQEGAAREQETIEHQKAAALDTIGEHLSGIAQSQAAVLEHTIKHATELALAIARKIAPEAIRRQPTGEIEAMIREFLPELAAEPRVVIRVADAVLDEITDRIDGLAKGCGFDGNVVLLAEPSLGAGDCRIEWADGGAERDLGAVWHEIETGLEKLLNPTAEADSGPPAPAPATSEPCDGATEKSLHSND